MSLRLLKSYSRDDTEVRVYRDYEWDEYSVRIFKAGIEQVLASYHTDDRADAISTAEIMIDED